MRARRASISTRSAGSHDRPSPSGAAGARTVKLLAFDTAAAACSAAVWVDGTVAAHRFAAMRRGHAEALLPMLRAAMADAGLGFEALDAVATTVGPGAFTGLRIGLSAARAIGLAAGIPVFGIGTLEAVAAAVQPRAGGRTILVALETQRAEVYAQVFDSSGAAIGPAVADTVEAVADRSPAGAVGVAGDAAERMAAALRSRRPGIDLVLLDGADAPDAVAVAELAARRVAAGLPPPDAPPPAPIYLRPPSVTLAGKAPG